MAKVTGGQGNISLTSRRTGNSWSEGRYTAALALSAQVPWAATVTSAKLTATVTQYPMSGAYIWLNGVKVRTRGSTVIDVSVAPGADVCTVECVFAGSGTDNVTSVVVFDLALEVTYTAAEQAASAFTLAADTVRAGSSFTVAITPGKSTWGHQVIFDFLGYQTASAVLEAGVTAVTVAVPVGWLAAIPSSASGVGTVTLRCWEGDKTSFFGATTKPLTVTAPASAGPDVGTVSVAPLLTVDGVTYPEVVSGAYVQGKSGYSAAISGASAKYGARIAAYSISGGGYSGRGATLKSGLLGAAGTQKITFRVTDSRGLSATKTVNITVLAYTPPRVTELTAWRVNEAGEADGMGTLGKVRWTDAYSALGGANTLTAKAYIKPVGGTEAELGHVAEGGIALVWSRKAIYLSGPNSGKETDSTNRIADLTYYSASQYTWNVTPDASVKLMIFSYDAEKQYLGRSEWVTNGQLTLSAGAVYFRVEASYSDDRAITDDNIATPAAVIKLVDTSAEVWWIAGTDGAKLTLDVTKRYVLRRVLTDAYGTVERSMELPSANFAMHLNAKGNGICFGGACSEEDAVEIVPEYDLVFKGERHTRLWQALELYPVGAIYLSTVATSPAELFGGTWKRLEGRFLLGCSADYPAGTAGGAAKVTLTVAQMPTHAHQFSRIPIVSNELTTGGNYYAEKSTAVGKLVAQNTETAGGGKAHTNMPPYLAVYAWERIA